jgi:hypothetical protein
MKRLLQRLRLEFSAALALCCRLAHRSKSVSLLRYFSRSGAAARIHALDPIRTSPELVPEGVPISGSDIVYVNFRFACAHLSRPYLPGSSSRLFRNAHHHGFWPQQLAVVWNRRPDRRIRRVLLHLQYRYAAPSGPALLVTQGTPSPSPLSARESPLPNVDRPWQCRVTNSGTTRWLDELFFAVGGSIPRISPPREISTISIH